MSEYTGKKISSFQERFTELCDSNPMNDASIANALHVSKGTVHYWKLGERSPKTPTVIAIAQYFGVDVAWLMGFDVEKIEHQEEKEPVEQPMTEEARILAKGIDKLPQEQREQALSVIKAMFAKYADYFEKENNNEP